MKPVIYSIVVLIAALVIISLASIYSKNRTPQVAIGLNDDGQFYELSDKPNCISTQTSYIEKKVAPLEFKGSLKDSKGAIYQALEAYGGIEIVEDTDTYVYCIATTSLMRYKDDVEFLFDETEQLIHYRSSSRAGYSDMGLNKERYDRIVKLYYGE